MLNPVTSHLEMNKDCLKTVTLADFMCPAWTPTGSYMWNELTPGRTALRISPDVRSKVRAWSQLKILVTLGECLQVVVNPEDSNFHVDRLLSRMKADSSLERKLFISTCIVLDGRSVSLFTSLLYLKELVGIWLDPWFPALWGRGIWG